MIGQMKVNTSDLIIGKPTFFRKSEMLVGVFKKIGSWPHLMSNPSEI